MDGPLSALAECGLLKAPDAFDADDLNNIYGQMIAYAQGVSRALVDVGFTEVSAAFSNASFVAL